MSSKPSDELREIERRDHADPFDAVLDAAADGGVPIKLDSDSLHNLFAIVGEAVDAQREKNAADPPPAWPVGIEPDEQGVWGNCPVQCSGTVEVWLDDEGRYRHDEAMREPGDDAAIAAAHQFDDGVLGVHREADTVGVWRDQSARQELARTPPGGEVVDELRSDERPAGTASVRQPAVFQPRPSLSGNTPGQSSGQGGERAADQGGSNTEGTFARAGGAGDTAALGSRGIFNGVGKRVRYLLIGGEVYRAQGDMALAAGGRTLRRVMLPFYFRARGEHWSLDIAAEPGDDPVGVGWPLEGEWERHKAGQITADKVKRQPGWSHEEEWPDGPCGAGWMTVANVVRCITKAVALYRQQLAGLTEEQPR